MTVFSADSIVWDLDGDETAEELNLPDSVSMVVAEDHDDVANVLSDRYGFCILSLDAYQYGYIGVGDKVRVSDCSGIYSNCEAEVIKPVPWNQVQGMYQMPDRDKERCLRRISDGTVFYMFLDRMKKLEA